MAKDEEKTLKLVTNLDRKAIEAKLAQVRADAQSSNLKELADLFNGVEGMPRAQIEQKVKNALKWLADKPQHNRIASQLELVGINLHNLK
jgi:ATP phosphoribosyltransferase